MRRDTELPPVYTQRIQAMLGSEADAFFRAAADPEPGLRVNTLRISPDAFIARAPFPVDRLAFPAEGFTLAEEVGAGVHPYHAAGLYYLQDPGAMAVAALLDAQPGDRVLDLSAAPGGKATHLAARMRGEGLLLANDVSRSRARELLSNLERCGVRNAVVTSESAERLANHFGAWFDRVLVDAPCSGESMFHKSAAARGQWSEAAVAGCARRQSDILTHAARLVAPGGRLLYSTCTFAREENEEVVEAFLGRRPDYRLTATPRVPGGKAGTGSGGEAVGIRLWPHLTAGAGHFAALLVRSDQGEGADHPLAAAGVAAATERLARDFCEEVLPSFELPPGSLAQGGSLLELQPGRMPAAGRIPMLRRGLALGTLERGRFEPAHALAMAAGIEPAKRLDLELGDERIERYLEGEVIRAAGPAGWLVVRVDGYPLGWGKRTGDTVKNHYPKGLRQRAGKG